MDATSIEERLQELLDQKDEETRALQKEVAELRRLVKADPFLWALQAEVPERGLPVPRLEIEWTPHSQHGWHEASAVYRLVHRHLQGHVVGVGIGQTTVRGGWPRPPIRGTETTHRPGKIELPRRDGAHICHDMVQLNLPAFAICGDQIDDLSDLAGKPWDR